MYRLRRFSYLHPDRNRYITGRALGSDYEKDYLERIIKDKAKGKEHDLSYDYHADPVAILYVRSHLHLVVDLQTNIKAQQSAAYARKVKLSNLKVMARTVVYIQEHGYDIVGDLQMHRQQIAGKKDSVQKTLAQMDARIKAINEQIHLTGQYYACNDETSTSLPVLSGTAHAPLYES